MMSREEQKLVNFVMRLVCIYHVFPHDFNKVTRVMEVATGRLKLICFYLSALSSLLYSIFLVIRLQPGYGYSRSEIKSLSFELLLHYFLTSVHFTCFIMQIYSIEHGHDFALLFNQIVYFNKHAGIKYFEKEHRERCISSLLLNTLSEILGIVVLLFIAITIIYPEHRHYLYSALEDTWKCPFTYLVFELFEIFIVVKAGVCGVFYMVFGYFYIWTLNFWIKQACTEWLQRSLPTVNNNEVESIKVYRVITCINNLYNGSISIICVPAMKACIEFLAVLTMFGTLRFYRDLPVPVYVLLPVAAALFGTQSMMVISLLANVNTESLKLGTNFQALLQQKSLADKKYFAKLVASCGPIKCRIGAPYFVERSTKIKYAGLLVDLVLTLLINTKRRSKY